jgi:hypothetical protein
MIFSWREAHISAYRLVTGTGTKYKINHNSLNFKLEAQNFACKLILTARSHLGRKKWLLSNEIEQKTLRNTK